MPNFQLIQITLTIPPSINGIGQYTCRLAESLYQQYGILSAIVVVQKPDGFLKNQYPIPFYFLSESGLLLDTLVISLLKEGAHEHPCIVIQFDRGLYDAYLDKTSYNRYQLQRNLAKALEQIKVIVSNICIIVVFHEFLSPRILQRRDYILRPLQRWYMKRILTITDFSICSNPVVERLILGIYPKAKVHIHPVFSNVGEPTLIEASAKSHDHWVIFGSTDNIIKTLRSFIADFSRLSQCVPIRVLQVIGGQENLTIQFLLETLRKQIEEVYYRPAISHQQASEVFKKSRFCYMYYFDNPHPSFPLLLFKSGVFATACAHGTIPVLGHTSLEGVSAYLHHPGVIFIRNGNYNFDEMGNFDALSKALFNWYQRYSSLKSLTKMFEQIILN